MALQSRAAVTAVTGLILAARMAAGQPTSPSVTPTNVPADPAPAQPIKPAVTPRPAAPGPGSATTVDLRPKFRTGQTLRYVLDQTAHNSVKSGAGEDGLDQDQRQTQKVVLVLNVVQAGDEGATIEVKYESIKASLTTPDGVAEYDSAKPPAKPANTATPTKPGTPARPGTPTNQTPPAPAPAGDPLKDIGEMDMSGMLALVVGPMVGATVTVKTDRNGAITGVTGGETLGGGLGGGLGGLGALGGMGGAVVPSPAAVANWLVAGVGGPNNKGVARLGESWTNNDALTGTPVGAFTMKTTHTLKSASGGAANIAFVGGIEPVSAAPPGTSIGQVQSASYTGAYIWDTRTGGLSELTSDMRIALDAAVGGTKAKMTSETQVKVRRQ